MAGLVFCGGLGIYGAVLGWAREEPLGDVAASVTQQGATD